MECGSSAIAALVMTIVEEPSVSDIDVAPSLNGLGDFVIVEYVAGSAWVASDVGWLPPGTRPGY